MIVIWFSFFFLSSLFSVILRVNKFIFFQPFFIFIMNEIITYIYHYMINACRLKWDEFFFSIQFNPVRSVILRNITFVFDEILKEIVISFLFIQTKRHMTNVFSLHNKHHTSNNKRVFPTMTLLSTSFFQHLFIFQQFEPSNTFTFWSHHRHLKSRQMNRLFLSINYLQFISSWGWGEGEGVCVRRVWEDE